MISITLNDTISPVLMRLMKEMPIVAKHAARDIVQAIHEKAMQNIDNTLRWGHSTKGDSIHELVRVLEEGDKVTLEYFSPHVCIVGGKPRVSMDNENRNHICCIENGDKVLSKDGKIHKVKKTFNSHSVYDKPDLVRVNCEHSYMKNGLLLTSDHLVLTYDESNEYPYWEKIGKLKVGDYIIKKIKLPWNRGIRKTYKLKCVGCNNEFDSRKIDRKYCCWNCYTKHTDYSRNKGMHWNLSEEQRLKHCGDNNASWKGGISKLPYGKDWTEIIRSKVKSRDNYTCQMCGINKNESKYLLVVHHKDENKLNNSIDNLVTLCSSCHSKLHWCRDSEFVFIDWNIFKPERITLLEHIDGRKLFNKKGAVKKTKLYDLSVDGENSFVVNGIVVHNSIVEYGGVGRTIDARDYGHKAWPVGASQGGGVMFSKKVKLQEGKHFLSRAVQEIVASGKAEQIALRRFRMMTGFG